MSKILEVSANEKYNLIQLVDEMIYALPNEKKITVLRSIAKEYVSDNAESNAAKGLMESALGGLGGDVLGYFSESWRESGEKVGELIGRRVDEAIGWFKSLF